MEQMSSRDELDVNSTPDTGTPVISGAMSIDEILCHLATRDCKDVTDQLDISRCSREAVSTGGFGDVYCGALINGARVGLKCLRLLVGSNEKGRKQLKHAAHELYVWSKCNHPNVLPLIGVAKYRSRLAMISPWMENGTLSWFLSQDPEVDRHSICIQIADGVAYLHGEGIVHGDLKAANILVSQDHVPQLTDFGNAIMREYTLQFTATQSLPSMSLRWTAPELFLEETTGHTAESDVYALGMTFLEVISGSVPYADVRVEQGVMRRIMFKIHPVRLEEYFPSNDNRANLLWSTLTKCWAYDPMDRPSALEVLQDVRANALEGFSPKILEDHHSNPLDEPTVGRGTFSNSLAESTAKLNEPGPDLSSPTTA